jgi:hypothetical protein
VAIEYWLVLEGDLAVDAITTTAFPDPSERPTATGFADLYDRLGYGVTIRAGNDGYFQGESDPEVDWLWKPRRYVQMTFRLDKAHLQRALRNLLPVVARVLTSGSENAAFLLNGDYLLLSRTHGVLTKHRRPQWWDHYGWVDDLVPGPAVPR